MSRPRASSARAWIAGLLAGALAVSLVAGVAHRSDHAAGARPCTICVHSHTPLLATAEAPPLPVRAFPKLPEAPRRVCRRVTVPTFPARAPPVV